MRKATRVTASAVVGGLVLLCLSVLPVAAQSGVELRPVTHIASIAPGSIQGVVQDEHGAPVAGATVSALGATPAFAVSDRTGRFELRTLSPGPYLLSAHLSGFVASRGQVVDVRPSARASSAIALRRSSGSPAPYPVLAAGIGETPEAPPAPTDVAASPSPATADGGDNHGDIAWRLRHARRGVLKDATLPPDVLDDDPAQPASGSGAATIFGRASESSARLAADFFAGTPFSGQVNLLTTGTFDSPQQLFSGDNFSRSTTYLALGAPVGEHADWTARAALAQGDLSSWMVAGEYTTRAPARHRYDIGLSYSTQRYEGGNFATLHDVTDGSRNAGAISAFDTFSVAPSLTLTYGTRYARYDYLDGSSLVSPRVAMTLAPTNHFRVSTMLSSRATAPGAEEFMPRIESGIWLPPQRTFSSLVAGQPFDAERTTHAEVEMERDVASATLTLRAFRQHVDDQLATLFGINMTGMPPAVGHYYVTTVAAADASGVSAGVHTALASRVHGSVEYTLTQARLA